MLESLLNIKRLSVWLPTNLILALEGEIDKGQRQALPGRRKNGEPKGVAL